MYLPERSTNDTATSANRKYRARRHGRQTTARRHGTRWRAPLNKRDTNLKKSARQNSFPSREKHFSVKFCLHSQHWTHFACQALSRTFKRNLSKIGRSHPAHCTTMTTDTPLPSPPLFLRAVVSFSLPSSLGRSVFSAFALSIFPGVFFGFLTFSFSAAPLSCFLFFFGLSLAAPSTLFFPLLSIFLFSLPCRFLSPHRPLSSFLSVFFPFPFSPQLCLLCLYHVTPQS